MHHSSAYRTSIAQRCHFRRDYDDYEPVTTPFPKTSIRTSPPSIVTRRDSTNLHA